MSLFSILLMIGLILVAVSLGLALNEYLFISQGTVADGTVVENVPRGKGGSPRYSPKIKFRTAQGKDVFFMTTFSSNPPAYNEGDTVKVVYQDEGEGARILSFALRFAIAWPIMGAGLALIIVAFGFKYGDALLLSRYARNATTFGR